MLLTINSIGVKGFDIQMHNFIELKRSFVCFFVNWGIENF